MTPEKSSSILDVLGIVAFVTIVCLFAFVSIKAGTRGMGVTLVFVAGLQQIQGRIAYGWEGQKPSGFLTGWLAFFVNLIMAAAGLAFLVWPEVAMGMLGWDSN